MLLEVMHEALTDERRTFPLRVKYTQQRRDLMGLNAELHAPPHPQKPLIITPPTGEKINDAYEAWIEIRQAPERTRQTYKRHADQFIALMGNMPLQAVGRTPNGKKIAADKAGVAVTDRGFIPVDVQMRTNVPNIFAIGDIVGQPMLAHKGVHEGHVAAEVAAGGDSKPAPKPSRKELLKWEAQYKARQAARNAMTAGEAWQKGEGLSGSQRELGF